MCNMDVSGPPNNSPVYFLMAPLLCLVPKPLNMIPEGLEKVGYEGFFMRNVDQKWRFITWAFFTYNLYRSFWSTLRMKYLSYPSFFLVPGHHIKRMWGQFERPFKLPRGWYQGEDYVALSRNARHSKSQKIWKIGKLFNQSNSGWYTIGRKNCRF